MGAEGLLDEMRPLHVLLGIYAPHTQLVFHLLYPRICEVGLLFLLFYLKMRVLLEAAGYAVCNVIAFGGFFGGTGYYERGAGLVYKDAVHLVNYGVMEFFLYLLPYARAHVVP